jgi:hypothetical protein
MLEPPVAEGYQQRTPSRKQRYNRGRNVDYSTTINRGEKVLDEQKPNNTSPLLAIVVRSTTVIHRLTDTTHDVNNTTNYTKKQ